MDLIIFILLAVLLIEVTFIVLQIKQPHIKRDSRRRMFVDTSVLIDGRIVALAQSGFIYDTLSIPRSVIGELQFLADNADSEKRSRARHGLDVVTELQALDQVEVEIFPDGSHAEEGVDERLLKLAKKHDGILCTIDYNLNKVAQVEGIGVANVNELAKSLRMAYLPGERLSIALTTKGNDNSQAVGHLDDGTMVVVEQAKSKIGSIAEIEVIRSLQTDAGRMMFARLVEQRPATQTAKKTTPSPRKDTPRVEKRERSVTTKSQDGSRPSAQPKTTEKKRASAPRRRSPKAKNNEDRLIELVNSQQE